MKAWSHSAKGLMAVLGSVLVFASGRAWAQADSTFANMSVPAATERQKLLAEHFTEVRDAAAFPASCRRGFAALARTHDFELANPGQPYQATDVVSRRLPWRRLFIGGASSDRCVVFYEIGGFATHRAVVVLDISQKTPVLVWGGADGKNPADLRELISQIVEGAFRPSSTY